MSETLRQILESHKKNLERLRAQAAQHGVDVPLELQNSIDYERQQIANVQAELDAEQEQAGRDVTEERIARLFADLASLSMEAAGYGSKTPPKLEQLMAAKRAEIARLRRMLRPEGRNDYQDVEARIDSLELQMTEVKSILTVILGRLNPTIRNRSLGLLAAVFITAAIGQWSISRVWTYYTSNSTALALGLMVTAMGLVVATLLIIVRRYVAT